MPGTSVSSRSEVSTQVVRIIISVNACMNVGGTKVFNIQTAIRDQLTVALDFPAERGDMEREIKTFGSQLQPQHIRQQN